MFKRPKTGYFIGTAVMLILLVGIVLMSASAPRMGNSYNDVVSGYAGGDYRIAPAAQPINNVSLEEGDFQAPLESDDGIDSTIDTSIPRVVIKNASLTLVVQDAEQTLAEIAAMTDDIGGWVVTSNTYQTSTYSGDSVIRGSITVRVPSARLNQTLEQLKGSAIEVTSESVTGEDVTQQYVDLTSRLANLEAAEQQLQQIMETARRTEDVVMVYNELVRVRGEIETIQGRINYFNEASAFSSISIDLVPDVIANPPRVEVVAWSPLDVAGDAVSALAGVFQFLASALIVGVIFVLPLVALVGVPAGLVYRVVRRRQRPSAELAAQ